MRLATLLRLPSRPILWLATLLHLITGVMLIIDPRVAQVTGLKVLAGSGTGTQPALVGLVFVASALFALSALLRDLRAGPAAWTFWAFLPQQALAFIMAAGAVYAVMRGFYSSGTVLPRSFIFTDQLPKLLLAILHPFGVLRMHIDILPLRVSGPVGGAGGQGGHGGAGGAGSGGAPGEPGEPGAPGEPGR
jgi:uncharacterized membrane protein YgcG